jgi:hypothetical protein
VLGILERLGFIDTSKVGGCVVLHMWVLVYIRRPALD